MADKTNPWLFAGLIGIGVLALGAGATAVAPTVTEYIMDKTWDLISDTKIKTLHPKIRAAAIKFLNDAAKAGIKIRVTSGLRTYEEQGKLYAQGRTQQELNNMGYSYLIAQPQLLKVTNAAPGYSLHNFGLALDVVEIKDGKAVGFQKDYPLSRWSEIATYGKANGFSWGGDWTGFKDRPHFQNMFGKSLAQLRDLYNGNKIKDGYVIV